ncbi:MAG: hypothetical protein ACHQWU_13225 [Gemmatimonadales bacterium]
MAVEEDEVRTSSRVVRLVHPKQALDRGLRSANALWIELLDIEP